MAHGKGGLKTAQKCPLLLNGPIFRNRNYKKTFFQNFDFVFTNFYKNDAEKLDRDRES